MSDLKKKGRHRAWRPTLRDFINTTNSIDIDEYRKSLPKVSNKESKDRINELKTREVMEDLPPLPPIKTSKVKI